MSRAKRIFILGAAGVSGACVLACIAYALLVARYQPAVVAAPGYDMLWTTRPGLWAGLVKSYERFFERRTCDYVVLPGGLPGRRPSGVGLRSRARCPARPGRSTSSRPAPADRASALDPGVGPIASGVSRRRRAGSARAGGSRRRPGLAGRPLGSRRRAPRLWPGGRHRRQQLEAGPSLLPVFRGPIVRHDRPDRRILVIGARDILECLPLGSGSQRK
jgi:hypothetical protein